MNDHPVTEPKRFTGDLRTTILEAVASVGSDGKGTGGLAGFLDKFASEHPGTKLAKQAMELKRRLEESHVIA